MKKCEKHRNQRPRQVCVKAPETSVIGVKCNPLQYNQESLMPTHPTNVNFAVGNQESLMSTHPTNVNFAVGVENSDHDDQWFEASLSNDDDSSSSEEDYLN